MKNAFKPKNMKSKYMRILIMAIFIAHNNKELKLIRPYLILYIWSKMLSASRDALLKLSKTTSPQKLIDYDCMTLYN